MNFNRIIQTANNPFPHLEKESDGALFQKGFNLICNCINLISFNLY